MWLSTLYCDYDRNPIPRWRGDSQGAGSVISSDGAACLFSVHRCRDGLGNGTLNDANQASPERRNRSQPARFVADGAVVLVAAGAKGFFEPGLGNRGKLRVLMCVEFRCRTPRGLP